MIIGKVVDRFHKPSIVSMLPKMACRHGLISGVIGGGKTLTARLLAERFSSENVPVFITDIKGDVSSICKPANLQNKKLQERIEKMQLVDFEPKTFPTVIWDIFGESGKPLQTNVAEVGHLFMSRMMDLPPVPAAVLNILFMVAKENFDLKISTLEDLQFMAKYAGNTAQSLTVKYGNVTRPSVGVIQRSISLLRDEGADKFFNGSFNLDEMLRKVDGLGVINVLSAEKLIQSPRLYAAVLLWLLNTIYNKLPEVGEVSKPRLAFIVDEAHLLFRSAPDTLLEKIEQIVRLIRSKGVAIFFVTQNPLDIPDAVLGQLGNRVQHALRPSTPRDARSIKAIAKTFTENPLINPVTAITELGIGEALVSMLNEFGAPEMVRKLMIYPPQSRIEPLTRAERQEILKNAN
jgi:uncharacterized protein